MTDLLAEDIYVLMVDFYRDLLGGLPPNTSPKTLISGYLFARRIPEKRLYRSIPSRVMLTFFKRLMLRRKEN